jgi:hypothetical protein
MTPIMGVHPMSALDPTQIILGFTWIYSNLADEYSGFMGISWGCSGIWDIQT